MISSQDKKQKFEPVAVVIIALLLGIIIRLGYILKFPFPLNDGGLFYKLTTELVNNHFLLPKFSAYNNLNFPFVYPPLPFYLAGSLNSFLKIDLFTVFRFLPFVFNILTIPLVYFIARKLLKNDTRVYLAVMVYALIRPGYEWFIYGGGLTRSIAWFFALLAILQILIYFDSRKIKHAILIPFWFSLTILCHLEIGWFLVFSFLLLTIFLNRSWKGLIAFVSVGVATLLLTSFYWIRIISLYGIGTLFDVFHAGQYNFFYSFLKVFQFNYTSEVFLPILSSLAFLGVFAAIASRQYLLPVWLLAILLLDPRSVDRSSILVISFLAAIAIESIVLQGFKALKKPQAEAGLVKPKKFLPVIHLETAFISLIFIVMFFGALLEIITGINQQISSISQEDFHAMRWVKEYTPEDSRFLVVDSAVAWHIDAQAEWFPALTDRQSILTPQGTEWLPGRIFDQKTTVDDEFRRELINGNDFLPSWLVEHQNEYQYVYFEKDTLNHYNLDQQDLPGFLRVVYESNSVLITQKH